MKILISKRFIKDLSVLPNSVKRKVEKIVFEDIAYIEHVYKIEHVSKLKGYKEFYKIRIGEYRVGLRYSKGTLYFERVLHRKEIYRFYPDK